MAKLMAGAVFATFIASPILASPFDAVMLGMTLVALAYLARVSRTMELAAPAFNGVPQRVSRPLAAEAVARGAQRRRSMVPAWREARRPIGMARRAVEAA